MDARARKFLVGPGDRGRADPEGALAGLGTPMALVVASVAAPAIGLALAAR